jgi:hypothetical protein
LTAFPYSDVFSFEGKEVLYRKECDSMPQVMMDISVDYVAKAIQAMTHQELETLSLLLTSEGQELFERQRDLHLNRVTFLSREETFGDVS